MRGKAVFAVIVFVGILSVLHLTPAVYAKDMGPIRIGFMAPLSGQAAQIGKDAQDGMNMGLEEIGNQMAGRKVEIFRGDTEMQASKALTKIRQLVEENKVDVVIGPIATPTAVAIVPYVDAKKIPTMGMASEDELTQKKIPKFMFRIGWTTSQPAHALGDYAYKFLKYRTVSAISLDMSFGWETVGGFQRVFEDLGGKVVQKIWYPWLGISDFSPYIPQIRKDVDAVFIMNAARPAIQFLKQYKEIGYTLPMIGGGTSTDESVLPAMGDEALGVITALHYSAAIDTPRNKEFVKKYRALTGKVPSYFSEEYYGGILWINEAVKALKGDISDKTKFLAALKAVKMELPRGPMRLDSYGNPIENVYIRKVERVNGELQNSVIYTYKDVSQFWTFNPKQYLSWPLYSRDYPPVSK